MKTTKWGARVILSATAGIAGLLVGCGGAVASEDPPAGQLEPESAETAVGRLAAALCGRAAACPGGRLDLFKLEPGETVDACTLAVVEDFAATNFDTSCVGAYATALHSAADCSNVEAPKCELMR